MLETFGRCNYSDGHTYAFDMFVGSWCYGSLAYCWIFRKGKGRRRRILSTMEQCATRQHTHFVRLVVCIGLGRRCIQFDCCYSTIWCCCMLAQWTRKGRTIEFAVLDARYVPSNRTHRLKCVWPTNKLFFFFFFSNLVYPQKQPPYAYGGYPQPQMYPVHPYQGSQYGPYHY